MKMHKLRGSCTDLSFNENISDYGDAHNTSNLKKILLSIVQKYYIRCVTILNYMVLIIYLRDFFFRIYSNVNGNFQNRLIM